jgi:hypothetical protein
LELVVGFWTGGGGEEVGENERNNNDFSLLQGPDEAQKC